MKSATLAALRNARAARRPVALAKNLADGTEFLLPDPAALAALNEAGNAALAADKTGTHAIGNETWFIEAQNPAPRLLLIGAVHIAQALVPLAAMTGFETILIDPRRAFGNQDRFPGATIVNEWPDEALQKLNPDPRSAVVTLTHDPKLDDPGLDEALKSGAFYIGALGSRKTHASRLERLAALGHTPEALARIHGPVGLNIGAVTAPEIALSIVAELVAARRGPK
jgi:xanthine dehydrogenase accessory factor